MIDTIGNSDIALMLRGGLYTMRDAKIRVRMNAYAYSESQNRFSWEL